MGRVFRSLSKRDPWDSASLLLGGITAIIAILTLGHYGMSWDEWFRWRGGQEKLLFYLDWLRGSVPNPNPQGVPDNYPGLFDLTVALLNHWFGISLFWAGHSLSLFFGGLALGGAWATAYRLGGSRSAFFTLLLLILTPRFYGHQFFNPKDIPFAAGYIWAVYSLLRCLPRMPCIPWKNIFFLGLAIGLALSLRVGALVLFGYVGLFFLWGWLTSLKQSDTIIRSAYQNFIHLAARISIVVALSLVTLYPWWPYGQENLIEKLIASLMEMSNYPWDGHVLFAGTFTRATQLPWYYSPVWFLITLPPIILLAIIAGAIVSAPKIKSYARNWDSPKVAGINLILLAAFFPIVYVIIRESTLYDGMRHLLFVVPPACVIAGLSINKLFRLPSRPIFRWALAIFLIIGSLQVATSMIRLHPYQHAYFNGWIGGLPGAEGDFETEYWGTAKREAVYLLEEYLAEEYPPDYRPRVASSMPILLSRYFFPENWIPENDPEQADFYVSITRLNQHRAVEGEAVVQVEREGVVFALAKTVFRSKNTGNQ